jgi:outer membrane receptor protein involved in Fe transport
MSAKRLRTVSLLLFALRGTSVLAQGPAGPAPLAASPTARGAGRLTGTVTSAATGQPLAYASVAVLGAAGQPVGGGVGDAAGRFVLPGLAPGTYTVRVSLLGYQELLRPGVVVPAGGGEVALGPLALAAADQKLGEVVVTARRPLVEELIDRTVYHAENDATTRGGDATDVLRRVPLLSLDLEGNVSVRGNQNIKVLIDGKPSTLTANGVADGLRQLPADQIKRVEVITAPSAKYDAEGSGGLINIVTKGNALRGGQLSADGSFGTRSGTLNLNGGYRTGRMGFALGGFGRAGYNTPGSFSNEQLTTNPAMSQQTRTTQAADTRQNQLFGRYTLGWDFDIDKQNSLAASLTYGTRNATTYQDGLATATTELATGRASSSARNVQVTDESGTVDASLAYTHTYAVPQRELSALALYSRNDRTYAFANDTYAATEAGQLGRAGNDNPSANQEITAQLDYQTPLGERQLLEVGVKDIQRRVRSDYTYYGQLAASQAANSFTYRQQVAAGYAVYTLNLPRNFSLKPGLRYEYTALAADFGTGPVGDIPNYGLLVPSLSLLHKLPNGNALKLAYNRRLQRPSLQFLNPNLQAANPLVQTQGNPALRPEYTNNYELGYGTLLGPANLNFSVFARRTTGAIQSVRTPLADANYPGAVRIDYLNIGQEKAYGGSAFFSLDVGDKLSLSGGVDAYYAALQNDGADPRYAARNAGWVLGGRLYGSYALPRGWNVALFSFYRGQQVQLQGSQSSFALYSMSLKHDVAGKKGSLGLGAENFFSPTNAVRSDIASPLLSQQSTTVQHLTSFKIYFSYRVGKLTAEARPHKNVKNDDLKTDENGGGSQGSGGAPAATRPAAPASPAPAPPAPAAPPASPAPAAPAPAAPRP